jgi:superfamily I DNA and/or RNA helicase
LLAARIPGVRVGTVDRFQGQQGAVVIYSLTSSSAEDAPRNMEFLYDPYRFNVATSRARCACIVVGSPALLAPECHTPKQMELANVLCRYSEMSTRIENQAAAAAGVAPH